MAWSAAARAAAAAARRGGGGGAKNVVKAARRGIVAKSLASARAEWPGQIKVVSRKRMADALKAHRGVLRDMHPGYQVGKNYEAILAAGTTTGKRGGTVFNYPRAKKK